MKKKINYLPIAAMLLIVAAGLMGCVKTYKIQVSTQNLYFGLEAGSQTIDLSANCEWTITKHDTADWYTISVMEGANDATITVTVENLKDSDFRGSSFVIESPGGHVYRTVFVSQNKLEFDGLVGKVFGVMSVEHWNTDYFGQMVESSYKLYEFDPYDTTTGYMMYFMENGQGIQRDHHKDTVAYYPFTYEYNSVDQILHIEFATITGAPEDYDPQVLTASDSLFRFLHEYKPYWWERADMRRVGTINLEEKALLKRAATKRKEGGAIFQF